MKSLQGSSPTLPTEQMSYHATLGSDNRLRGGFELSRVSEGYRGPNALQLKHDYVTQR